MAEFSFGIALAGLAGALLCAVTTESLREFSRSAFEDLCNRRRSPKLLEDVIEHHEETLLLVRTLRLWTSATFLVALWLWATGKSVEAAALPAPGMPSGARPWAALAVGLAALTLVEVWVPWSIGRLRAEPFLYYTWPLWRQVRRVLRPLWWAAQLVDLVGHRLAGRSEPTPPEEEIEDEIRSVVTEGHRGGVLEAEDRGMIEGVIELRESLVCEIMTPRTMIVSMPLAQSLEEAARFVNEAGHSRVPVYDKNRDDIVGICYAKDLLGELAQPAGVPRRTLAEVLRKTVFVPETKPVSDLLGEFRHSRNHLAVVMDEFGGLAGLITMEDVLEEIVGDIADEYDDEHVEDIHRLDERTAEVLARTHVSQINAELGLGLSEDEEFDTVGGYVFHALGHVPRVGDVVEAPGVRITVLAVSRRRVDRVRIETVEQAPSEPAS